MKLRNLDDLMVFLEVARLASFSQAARELDLPLSVVSKRIARLEDNLGTRLFQRSTRAVHLTEEGRSLQPQIQRLFGDVQELEESFGKEGPMSGPVRVTMPIALSQGPIPKILSAFRKENPKIEVTVHFSDRIEKLVESGYDLAIRFSEMTDSALIAKKLGPNVIRIVATPQYLKKMGNPKTIKELQQHPMLVLPAHRNIKFLKSGISLGEIAKSSKLSSNNGPFLTEMCLLGGGIAARSHWDINRFLESKELVELQLNDQLAPHNEVYIVTPSNRYMSPRVRNLMDRILKDFPQVLNP